jgi:hypothetical protein
MSERLSYSRIGSLIAGMVKASAAIPTEAPGKFKPGSATNYHRLNGTQPDSRLISSFQRNQGEDAGTEQIESSDL